MNNEIDGRLWVSKSDKSFLGKGRIELLEQIEREGSISKAAKAMKMSYKAAWDAIDAMNNLAEELLVERVTGGKGGGGTRLTPYAKELIATYKVLDEEHRRFMEQLTLRMNTKSGQMKLLDHMSVQVSARNQLLGSVIAMQQKGLNTLVTLKLKGDDRITAEVTHDSVERMQLGEGESVYALFKAGSVRLSVTPLERDPLVNSFEGSIDRIEREQGLSEVIIRLSGGSSICASVEGSFLDTNPLHEGSVIYAACRADTIILGRQ